MFMHLERMSLDYQKTIRMAWSLLDRGEKGFGKFERAIKKSDVMILA